MVFVNSSELALVSQCKCSMTFLILGVSKGRMKRVNHISWLWSKAFMVCFISVGWWQEGHYSKPVKSHTIYPKRFPQRKRGGRESRVMTEIHMENDVCVCGFRWLEENTYYSNWLLLFLSRFLCSSFNVCVVGDNFIKIWDILSGGRLLMTLNSHHKTVTSLCFCMNYKRLVSASLDRFVTVNLILVR